MIGVAGFSISGQARVEIFTSATATFDETITVPGGTVTRSHTDYPSRDVKRIAIDDVNLAIASQTLSNADIAFGRSGDTLTAAVAGASVDLGSFELGAVTGTLVVGGAGLAGSLAATLVASPIAFTNARFAVLVNTGTAAVSTTIDVGSTAVAVEVPAGPYLRIDVTRANASQPLAIVVLGQQLQGEFSLEAVTASNGPALRIAASDVAMELTAGGATVFQVSGGEGFVVVRSDGVGARITGTASVTVPGVAFAATVDITINTVATAFSETFTVGARTVTLALPGGGPGGFVRAEGTGVSLVVGGQTLTADLTFEQATGTTTIAVANGRLSLGDGTTSFFAVTGANGSVVISRPVTAAVVVGTLTIAAVTVTAPAGAPGFALTGPVALDVDTGAGFFGLRFGDRSTTSPGTLTVLGQSLSGFFAVEVRADAAGGRAVLIAVEDAELVLTAGGPPPCSS